MGTYAGVPEADDALADRVVVVHTDNELGHVVAVREGQIHDAGAGTAAPEASVLPDAAAVAAAVAAVDRAGIRTVAAGPVVDAVDDPSIGSQRIGAVDLRDAGGAEVLEVGPLRVEWRCVVVALAIDVHPQVDGGGGAPVAALRGAVGPAAVVEAGADLVAVRSSLHLAVAVVCAVAAAPAKRGARVHALINVHHAVADAPLGQAVRNDHRHRRAVACGQGDDC